MLHTLSLITMALAVAGSYAAVMRDLPILNAFVRPATTTGHYAAHIVGAIFLPSVVFDYLGFKIGGASPLAYTWPLVLVFLAWCVVTNLRGAAVLLALLCPSSALAFNALGHKVIADIAWQELDGEARQEIVATLRRHPRFDDDFARKQDETVTDEDRWIFQHAATWPDIARGLPTDARKKYNNPSWHYVNFPNVIDGTPAPDFDLNMGDPRAKSRIKWNVAEALAYSRRVLNDGESTPQAKALAYCWLFHLVGDLHQPMHSTALVCERFPGGDRGGNLIPLVQGDNLHAIWDNFLGRQHRMADVQREIAELRRIPEAWKVDTTPDVPAWIDESRKLAESTAYDPLILAAVEHQGELAPINLPRSYLTEGGRQARLRVVAAGLRLAALLGAKPNPSDDSSAADDAFGESFAPRSQVTPSGSPALAYWLNTNGNVRHNSSCRWYQNTKRGRACGADEGKPCGICGG